MEEVTFQDRESGSPHNSATQSGQDTDHLGVGSQARILLVEDEPMLRQTISTILEDSGYRVTRAADAHAALQALREDKPDLVVSDIIMPGMDGFTFFQQVRRNAEWSQTPFIFLTAMGTKADIRHGMGLGADDYLVKPFEPEELLSAIQVRLARAAEAKMAMGRISADLRTQIMRVLTHEFRTPLTLITGYAELVEVSAQEVSDGELQELLRGLYQGTERLRGLVEDLLLVSKLETGALVAEIKDRGDSLARADEVVGRVVRRFEDQASTRHVALSVETRALEAAVPIAERLLAEIVSRLVDNACKFSKAEGGGVTVTTRQEGGFWALEVADEGIGIRAEALPWIFEAFRQVDRERMEQQGAGLGLSIVRGLSEVHGGQVMVASEPGEGSRFTVLLPLASRRPAGMGDGGLGPR
jgi:two-component system sensor histidine kinase/response regulator